MCFVWADCVWMVGFVCVGLHVNGYFVCMGLCGKILRRWVGAVPMCPPACVDYLWGWVGVVPVCPPVSPCRGAFVVHPPAHNACIFGMETPLRGCSGGHAGTAPTVSFGWIVRGQVYRSLFTPKARSFIKSKGAHQMIDALLTLFLSLLSDSNQRPRDYKSRALAN